MWSVMPHPILAVLWMNLTPMLVVTTSQAPRVNATSPEPTATIRSNASHPGFYKRQAAVLRDKCDYWAALNLHSKVIDELIPIRSMILEDYRTEEYPFRLKDCAVTWSSIKNGKIFISIDVYTIMACKQTYTLPLDTAEVWPCRVNSSTLIQDGLPRKMQPIECTPMAWPTSVHMTHLVYAHNTGPCPDNLDLYLHRFSPSLNLGQTFTISKFQFKVKVVPRLTECFPTFRSSDNVFEEWYTAVNFQLVHVPMYTNIPNLVVSEAACRFRNALHQLFSNATFDGHPIDYSIETNNSQVLIPGPCNFPGSVISAEFREGFRNEIPLCEMCQSSFYLDKEQLTCLRCPEYTYTSSPGALSCQSCPNVFAQTETRVMDSVGQCYLKETGKFVSVRFGFVFAVVFYITYIAFVIRGARLYFKPDQEIEPSKKVSSERKLAPTR